MEEIAEQELISKDLKGNEYQIDVVFINQNWDEKLSEERLRRKRSINYLENDSDCNSDKVSEYKEFKKMRKSNKDKNESESFDKINGNLRKNKSELLPKQRKTKRIINEKEDILCSGNNLDVTEAIQTNKLPEEKNNVVIVPKSKSKETQNKIFKEQLDGTSPEISKDVNNLNEDNTTVKPHKMQEIADNYVTISKKKFRKPHGRKNMKEDCDNSVENQDKLEGMGDSILNVKNSRYQETNNKIELGGAEDANVFEDESFKEVEKSLMKQSMTEEVLCNVINDNDKVDNVNDEDNKSHKLSHNESFIQKKAPGRPKKNGEISYRSVKVVNIKIENKRRGRPPKISIEGDNNIERVQAIRKTPTFITNADGEMVKRSVGRPRKSLTSSLNETVISDENKPNNDTEGSLPNKRKRRSIKLIDESLDEENEESVCKKQKKNIKMIQNFLEITDDEWRQTKKVYKKVLGQPPKSLSLMKIRKLIANGKRRGRPLKICMKTEDPDDKMSTNPQITTHGMNPASNEVIEDNVAPEKPKRRSMKSLLLSNNDVDIQSEPLKSSRIRKKNSTLLIKRAKENITAIMNSKKISSISKVSPAINLKRNTEKAAEAPNTVLNIMNAAARRASLDKLANLEALLSKLEEEHENTKELLRISEIRLGEHK